MRNSVKTILSVQANQNQPAKAQAISFLVELTDAIDVALSPITHHALFFQLSVRCAGAAVLADTLAALSA